MFVTRCMYLYYYKKAPIVPSFIRKKMFDLSGRFWGLKNPDRMAQVWQPPFSICTYDTNMNDGCAREDKLMIIS